MTNSIARRPGRPILVVGPSFLLLVAVRRAGNFSGPKDKRSFDYESSFVTTRPLSPIFLSEKGRVVTNAAILLILYASTSECRNSRQKYVLKSYGEMVYTLFMSYMARDNIFIRSPESLR